MKFMRQSPPPLISYIYFSPACREKGVSATQNVDDFLSAAGP